MTPIQLALAYAALANGGTLYQPQLVRAVETSDGTKVADVAWCSPERHQINKEEFSCTIAPEICIEVLSPANSDEEMERKRALYVERGTLEYWVCDEFGRMSFFGRQAALERSELCAAFPDRIES